MHDDKNAEVLLIRETILCILIVEKEDGMKRTESTTRWWSSQDSECCVLMLGKSFRGLLQWLNSCQPSVISTLLLLYSYLLKLSMR